MPAPTEEFVGRAIELLVGTEITRVEGCEDGGLRVYLHDPTNGNHRWVRFLGSREQAPALGGSLETTLTVLRMTWPTETEVGMTEVANVAALRIETRGGL